MTTNTHPGLHGLHHVTSITAHAQRNLDFYTKTLGMRLVKKTVNQDDVSAYHLFYADAKGSAGTDLTFFDWAQIRPMRHGAGMATETGLRITGGDQALDAWEQHFKKHQVQAGERESFAGLPSLPFRDFEGQRLRLVAEPSPTNTDVFHPWVGSPVPLESAIVGLSSVTLTVADKDTTASFLTEIMGFRSHGAETDLFEIGAGGTGSLVRLNGAGITGLQGAGGVHHVAWRVRDEAQLLAWQRHLEEHGLPTSGEVERHYFKSLYFRIPGGILFEIATDGPGFTADGEDEAHLGEKVALPPFLEPHRDKIEAGLSPLNYEPANAPSS